MDFEELVSLSQNPRMFTHCNGLTQHWSGFYFRCFSVFCFVCLLPWTLSLFFFFFFPLPCSVFCFLDFVVPFGQAYCQLLFEVLKLSCYLFGSHKVQSCLAYLLGCRRGSFSFSWDRNGPRPLLLHPRNERSGRTAS